MGGAVRDEIRGKIFELGRRIREVSDANRQHDLARSDAITVFELEAKSMAIESDVDNLPRIELRHEATLKFCAVVDEGFEGNGQAGCVVWQTVIATEAFKS